MLNERLFLSFRHVMYSLRGGFLVRPLIIALALGCAGALLSALEETVPGLSAWAPKVLFPSHADPQVAQVVLAAIATSMMTVVSIVFAILLMTLTLASMQFSPRIIVSFARDRVTQQTLGIFLGTFSYCVAALPAARSVPQPFAPVLTVLGAMLLALACVAWLLFFIHHISQAISVNHIVDKIATETEAIIDEIMPEPRRRSRMPEAGPPEPSEGEGAVPSDISGYVRFIDIGRLVVLAKSYGVIVRVVRRVGHFVPAGVPLLMVSKGERLSRPKRRIARGLRPRPDQDPPAGHRVRHPADRRHRAPGDLAGGERPQHRDQLRGPVEPHPDPLRLPGGSGLPALRSSRRPPRQHPWPDFDRLVNAAFDQIRLYSRADVAVSLRMLRALGDIATTIPDPAIQQTLAERGRQIVAGCAEALAEEELGKLRLRLSALEKLAISPEAR